MITQDKMKAEALAEEWRLTTFVALQPKLRVKSGGDKNVTPGRYEHQPVTCVGCRAIIAERKKEAAQ